MNPLETLDECIKVLLAIATTTVSADDKDLREDLDAIKLEAKRVLAIAGYDFNSIMAKPINMGNAEA